jgi:DNA replication protein DnaD
LKKSLAKATSEEVKSKLQNAIEFCTFSLEEDTLRTYILKNDYNSPSFARKKDTLTELSSTENQADTTREHSAQTVPLEEAKPVNTTV